MAIMLGDGNVAQGTGGYIRKTGVVRLGNTVGTGASAKVKFLNDYITADVYDANEGSKRVKLYLGNDDAPAGEVAFTNQLAFLVNGETAKLYDEDGTVIEAALTMAKLKSYWTTGITPPSGKTLDGHKVMFTYWVKATTKTITVSGDTFPGTYYIQGDTYSRSDVDGRDQFFQFIVPKAKLTAEQTITLEAEGDPSTFNMNLIVLRPESGEMMKLVQYDLESPIGTDDGSAG